MKELPMIMSTSMVIATLEDRKTQTRRVIPQRLMANADIDKNDSSHVYFECEDEPSGYIHAVDCAPYSKGDHLYVRETHVLTSGRYWDLPFKTDPSDSHEFVYYKAGFDQAVCFSWRPSIHLPKWAARIWLEVTGVRVERIQDITHHDAWAEGVNEGVKCPADSRCHPGSFCDDSPPSCTQTNIYKFKELWNSLNKKRGFGWNKNPHVWVYDFKRIEK